MHAVTGNVHIITLTTNWEQNITSMAHQLPGYKMHCQKFSYCKDVIFLMPKIAGHFILELTQWWCNPITISTTNNKAKITSKLNPSHPHNIFPMIQFNITFPFLAQSSRLSSYPCISCFPHPDWQKQVLSYKSTVAWLDDFFVFKSYQDH